MAEIFANIENDSRLIRAFGTAACLRDTFILLGVATAAAAVTTVVDVVERLGGWPSTLVDVGVDELLIWFTTFAFGLLVFTIRRVAELRREVMRRRENTRVLADFSEMARDWFWETDADLRFSLASPNAPDSAQRVAALFAQDGLTPPAGMGGEDWSRHWAEISRRKPFRGLRVRIEDREGKRRWVALSGKPLHDAGEHFLGYRGVGADVTTEAAAESKVRWLAMHELVTGLPNRTLLLERIRQAAAQIESRGGAAAVLCIDLDGFKQVNDSLGHAVGDQLLKACADRLQTLVGEADTLARIDGDEFVILQQQADQPGAAQALCTTLLDRLAEPLEVGDHRVALSACIGVALVPQDGWQPEDLLRQADIALQQARASGRGKGCFFTPALSQALVERRALEDELRRAMAQDEFELHYQPQVESASRAVVGLEALVRWRHPERGLVLPSDFLPLAELSGLSIPLGAWILRSACQQAASWPRLRVSVNLSPRQFRHHELPTVVRRALEDSGVEPHRLELEITESALLQDPHSAFEILEQLRGIGARVAIDDFGGGYSTLGCLQRFTFDKIKIDRSFVARLGQQNDTQALVGAIMDLSRNLGVATCAEGVETAEQQAILRQQGCIELQGYYFSRPLEPDEINAMLPGLKGDGAEPSAERRSVA